MTRQDDISPKITTLYGIELPTKKRAWNISQGTVTTINFQFLDSIGNPVDLSVYCEAGSQCIPSILLRIREVIALDPNKITEIVCDIVDAEQGIITADIPVTLSDDPGVYNAEFGVFMPGDTFSLSRPRRSKRFRLATAVGDLAFTNQAYLWVNRGLFGNPMFPNAGPPTIDEVRLAIRDNAPEENRLLDELEFDLTELCYATEMGVRYWNESQPPINVVFDTRNYAVRDKWIRYITGQLLVTAAHRFRRNHLPYQAGGIAIDDQNKFQIYDQSGMMLMQEYKEWVKLKKVQINCMAAITSTGSSYSAIAYSIINTGV